MNGIQVKCYLFPNGVNISANSINQASEIRRFAIDYKTQGSYDELINKIKIAYGNLIQSTDDIKTYWQDEEKDFVCFSTDQETETAIFHNASFQDNKSTSSPLFKVYVSLKKTFEKCETKPEEPQVHFGIICDGCDGAVRGTRYSCTVCPDYDLCSTCKNKGIHKEHEFIVFTKPVRQRCPYGGRNRGFCRGMYRQSCPAQNRPNEQPQPSTSSAQNPFAGLFPIISNAIPVVNDPEQLKNFGEYLKQFLDPFGIDVDYYLDTKDKTPKEDGNKENEKQDNNNNRKSEEKETKTKETENLSFVKVDEKMDTSNLHNSESDYDNRSNNPILSDSNPSAPTKSNSSELIESAASCLKQAIENNSFIQYPKLPTEEKCEEINDSGFSVIDIEKELKYIKCVDQLKSMGYNDEGGWITRLVIAKNGNINQVLDAMQPK